MSKQAKIYKTSVYSGDTCLIAVLFVDLTGTPYQKSQIETITYSIIDLGVGKYDVPTPVEGHTDVELSVDGVFFDPVEKVYNGETLLKNFEWIPSVDAFPDAKHRYQVRIKVEPTTGICTPVIIEAEAV